MRTSLAWLGCFGVIKGFNDLMDHHVTGGQQKYSTLNTEGILT